MQMFFFMLAGTISSDIFSCLYPYIACVLLCRVYSIAISKRHKYLLQFIINIPKSHFLSRDCMSIMMGETQIFTFNSLINILK